MQLTGVRPSVCLIRPPHAAAAGLLLWARRAGDVEWMLHGRRSAAAALQQRRAAVGCGQCHVVSWRRQLNAELFLFSAFTVAPTDWPHYSGNYHNNNNISATLRFDSAVQCHLTAWLFCEGGGGVRFIPAWFLYFFVLHSVIFSFPGNWVPGSKNNNNNRNINTRPYLQHTGSSL